MTIKSTCKHCGSRILLIENRKGHRTPCDPDLVEWVPGVLKVMITPSGELLRSGIGGEKGYEAHWMKCNKGENNEKK